MCVSLVLVVASLFSPIGAPPADWPTLQVERADEHLLIFQVRLGPHVLTDGLFGYAFGSFVWLPLGQVADLLELPIEVDPTTGRATGWRTDDRERFDLDIARRTVTTEEGAGHVDLEAVALFEDDIYVATSQLARWLPVDFSVDRGALELQLIPRRTLPVELRLAREARWRALETWRPDGASGPRFPATTRPFRLLDWPVLDGSFDVTTRRHADDTASTTGRQVLLAQGDLLGMTGELFLGGSRGDETGAALADARLMLSRRDPAGGLLGPLGATDLRLGDLVSSSDPLISRGRPGRGFEIVRAAGTSDRASMGPVFDRMTVHGDALPGWDVELYRNDILFDVTTVGADGRYELVDVPLLIGSNVLRLVFYGPYGETRERIERVFVGDGLLRPGETDYRAGVYQQDVGLFQRGRALIPSDAAAQGELQWALDVARGLTRRLSVDAGIHSLALADDRHDYARLGLRASFLGASFRLRVLHDTTGGRAASVAMQRSVGRFTLRAGHTQLDDFVSDAIETPGLRRRSRVRLDGQLRLRGDLVLPIALNLRHEGYADAESFELRGSTGFTMTWGGSSLTNRWHLDLVGSDIDAAALAIRGTVLLHGRLRAVSLRGRLSYTLQPDVAWTHVEVTGRWRRGRRLGGTFGLDHGLVQGVTHVRAGIDWQLPVLRVGLDLGWGSDGSLRAGAALSFSLGRDPRSGHARLRAEPAARQGAVSARAFLDHNVNGFFDAGDEALAEVGFAVNGGRHAVRTGTDGVAHLSLSPYRHADLSVDERSLEDPFWVPQVEGIGFIPRPGAVWTADFPVVVTGEVDGTVTLRQARGRRVASRIRLQLVDPKGRIVDQVTSQYDGFYLFEKVRPGRYAIRVDPEQAARLAIRTITTVEVGLASGDIRTVDIELARAVESTATGTDGR